MYEKCESETENDKCLIKVDTLYPIEKMRCNGGDLLADGEFKYLAIQTKLNQCV